MSNNETYKNHTHLEIHPSLMLGIMGNQICFPQHNPCPRNVFSCSQTKAALSLYHSNYLNRIDKMGVMLNYGQKPLARTRYLNYLSEDKHPYGINAIVAIMCHSGYNVEDSILCLLTTPIESKEYLLEFVHEYNPLLVYKIGNLIYLFFSLSLSHSNKIWLQVKKTTTKKIRN